MFADIKILSSYNMNNGKATTTIVNTSAVGVTTAATIKMITAAYLLVERINAGVMIPNLDRIKITTGNWKITPEPIVNVATEDR